MPTPITTDTVFLVSGGARGITAHCVIALAGHFRCKFALLGRSPLTADPAWAAGAADDAALKKAALAHLQAQGDKPTPAAVGRLVNSVQAGREIQATLNAIAAAGGQAVYLSADVSDPAKVRAALAGLPAEWGRITALLHGAGTLADKLIEHKTAADFASVYAAKVAGLEHLLAAVPPEQLTHVILFSSVAGFYGNVGQADYAIANDVLNKAAYALERRYPHLRALAIDWGPWDGGMVTPQLRAVFDQRGIRVIPLDVGAKILINALIQPPSLRLQPSYQIVVGSPLQTPATIPARPPLTHTLTRSLRLTDSPFLGDHVVNEQAVLPMVSAMSWMASACEQIHPGWLYAGFDNYRVLKGIVFDDALAPEYTLELKETTLSADEIVIDTLIRSSSADGKPRFHYSASVTLKPSLPPAPVLPVTIPPGDGVSAAHYYEDGTLFHGYSFKGVERILRLDEAGVFMRCALPVVDTAYQGQFPVQAFNYFMADIGLQSIGIWSRHFYKMGSLPLRAGRGRHFRQGTFGQSFYVTMAVRSHSPTNVSASITLHDADGSIYLIIDDLEVTMSQRLNELFLKNRLPEAR